MALLFLKSHQSLVDEVVKQLWEESWDYLVLPSLFVLQQVRKQWVYRHGPSILPKMVTYVHPLGYTSPSILQEKPLSLGQGLLWTLDFFQRRFCEKREGDQREPKERDSEKILGAEAADLAGFARSLLHLWEHIDRRALYEGQTFFDADLWHREGLALPPSPIPVLYGFTTAEVVALWLKWWPQWLHQHKLCSQTRASFLAQSQALEGWKNRPSLKILVGIQSTDITPWGWLKELMALPQVYALLSPEEVGDALGPLKESPRKPSSKADSGAPSLQSWDPKECLGHSFDLHEVVPMGSGMDSLGGILGSGGAGRERGQDLGARRENFLGKEFFSVQGALQSPSTPFQKALGPREVLPKSISKTTIKVEELLPKEEMAHIPEANPVVEELLPKEEMAHIPEANPVVEELLPKEEMAHIPEANPVVETEEIQTILCESMREQAEVMAFLAQEALQDPGARVGLMVSCPHLRKWLNHALARYRIPLPATRIPLITTLLHTLWRGSMASWEPGELLILLRHPLILKQYPIADAMAAWIELYAPRNLTLSLLRPLDPSPKSAVSMDTFPTGFSSPRWLRRLYGRLYGVVGPLMEAMEKSLQEGTFHPTHFWIHGHVKALQGIIPHEQWDYPLVVEKLLQESACLLPDIGPVLYGQWMIFWTSSIMPTPSLEDSSLVLGTPEELGCLKLNRCIVDISKDSSLFPWMPKSWRDYFHISPTPLHPVHQFIRNHPKASLRGLRGGVWIVSQSPNPTPSVYRTWAKERAVRRPNTNPRTFEGEAFPRPTPALQSISISDVQRWITDREAFYQERILRLKPPGISPQQAWGMAMHALLEHFIRDFPPSRCWSHSQLHQGLRALADTFLPSMPWWQESSRLKLLQSIVDCEYTHRQEGLCESVVEVRGKASFSLKYGQIFLTGRADRIDYLPDGTAHIIDYKTGILPTFVSLDRLQSVQLPLEGLLVQGGFMGKPCPVSKISWWSLHLTKGCEIKTYPRSVPKLLETYAAVLPQWLDCFVSGTYDHASCVPRGLN